MIHFSSTLSAPNFSAYQIFVPYAVEPTLARTNVKEHKMDLFIQDPVGAATTARLK